MAYKRAGPQKQKEPKLVLVMGDHVEIRELLTEFLRRLGLIAIPVPDSQSATVVFEKLAVDLVLLDVVLPDADGMGLIPRFKKLRPGVPVVVLSGKLNDEAKVDYQSQADEVLHKPINLKGLEKILFRLLRLGLEH